MHGFPGVVSQLSNDSTQLSFSLSVHNLEAMEGDLRGLEALWSSVGADSTSGEFSASFIASRACSAGSATVPGSWSTVCGGLRHIWCCRRGLAAVVSSCLHSPQSSSKLHLLKLSPTLTSISRRIWRMPYKEASRSPHGEGV